LPGQQDPSATHLVNSQWVPYDDRGFVPASGTLPFTSFNHLPFLAAAEWVWETVGGINPDDANPGFKNVIVKPEPGDGVTNAVYAFQSIHGPIACSWTNDAPAKTFTLALTTPADITATVWLPCTNHLADMFEGSLSATNAYPYYLTNAPSYTNGAAVFQVGSGTYLFKVSNVNL
jgi:alpha-L-rhamnosidase